MISSLHQILLYQLSLEVPKMTTRESCIIAVFDLYLVP